MSEQLIQTPGTFGENGNFLLERELGTGGMGGVYMGRDKMLDRPVAVKVMLKEYGSDAEFVEKFKKEAQSVARLIHPNIAQVYSYGICDGMPYIAMELASGGSLYSLMNANPGKTDVSRVIKICQQVAQALQCASDQGCVHGDVKPENILLDANGNAKLVDFGLAAMQKDTNEIWGTPYYISPEKVKKEAVDFRADMYSLGGTLYHALTGVAPFEGDDAIAVVKKRFESLPKKPSEIRPELTPAIDELVMTMLAMEKGDRYPSFEALLEAFKNVLTTGLTTKLNVPAGGNPAAGGSRRVMTTRTRRAMAMRRPGATTVVRKPADVAATDAAADEKEEEEGGNLALKVVLVVLGAILLVGGVIGGLIWYKIANEKARVAEERSQIVGGIEKARGAIADTVSNAKKFADEFDAFAAKAVVACEQPTEELQKILPADQGALLKPAESQELLDAIAATNETAQAVAAAPNSTAPAATNAVTAATNAVPAKAAAKDATPKEEVKNEKPEAEPPSPVVVAMNELWNRAYGCQASAVRIRHAVRQIVKKGAEADGLQESTRSNMDKLAELSRTLVDMLDQVKASKDVENVRKGIAFIKSKGEKTVEQTTKRLRIEKLEADRKAKAEAAAAAEKERQEKLEAERKAKIEEETEAAKTKFELLGAQGTFRQLDWKGATRQLETLKSEFKTPEGQLAADLELRKVADMKKAQDVLVKSLKNYAFAKYALKGCKVVSIDEKEIVLERNKQRKKLTWQKFFKEHYNNLIEVVGRFVVFGRKNAGLSQKDVADALTGSALLIQIVCGEEPTAADRATTLAQESVKQFPDYLKTAQKIFPDVKFEATED